MKIYIDTTKTKTSMFQLGLNVSLLARNIGCSTSYMSQILNNKKSPSPKLAKKIAETLNLETTDIFTFENEEAN